MTSSKKKFLFLLIILTPSFFINYFTLTIIDHDNNLSLFSTILVIIFNLLNLFFAYIYYKYSFKVLFFFLIYCFILAIFFDFISEKLFNKNSIIKESNSVGWVLKANKNVNFKQQTLHGEKYTSNFRSSKKAGFREFGNPNSFKKKILIIGDSYTGGPYSSNEKMYYSFVKDNLKKNDLDYEWFVMGAGGYGTAQQIILLKENYDEIKPDIVLHQFCVNDFFDNSIRIGNLSTSHSQYYRRPFIIDDKILKVDTLYSKIYRFLFKYSFMFKKFDQIYIYKKFREFGRYEGIISEELIDESVVITNKLIFEMRKIIGEETLYFSTNCVDDKYTKLSEYWERIVINVSGYPLTKPSEILLEMKKKGKDVMHEDGGHLNDYGNMIYGKIISEELLKNLKR